MSNLPDPPLNSLDSQTIKYIDQLNLPIMQKHHLRILAHCLAILQTHSVNVSSLADRSNVLREWCDRESSKFNDQTFTNLLYEQLSLTEKKLNDLSQSIGKNISDLNIKDLIPLVQGTPNQS